MKSLEQLAKEQAAAMAEAKLHHSIAEQLPVTPDDVTHYVKSLPICARYKCDGILPALAIFEQFPAVAPLHYVSDTFGHLEPLELLEKEKPIPDENIKGGPFAFNLEVRQYSHGSYTVTLEFYARLTSGEIIEVNCDISGPDRLGNYPKLSAQFTEQRTGSDNRLIAISKRPNILAHSMADKTVGFYSGEALERAADYRYCFIAEYDEETLAAKDNQHAITQLRQLAEQLGETLKSGE